MSPQSSTRRTAYPSAVSDDVPITLRASAIDTQCVDGDLRAVWPLFDPDFRTVLAEKWMRDNDRDIRADGWDGAQVAAALADDV